MRFRLLFAFDFASFHPVLAFGFCGFFGYAGCAGASDCADVVLSFGAGCFFMVLGCGLVSVACYS